MLGRSFATLFLIILVTFTLAAQAPSGDISGVVDDPSGAVVPGVTVTLTNPATNAVRTALTNEAGLYVSERWWSLLSGPELIFSTPMHSWTGFRLDRSTVMATRRGTQSSVRASWTSMPRSTRSSRLTSRSTWNFELRSSTCRIIRSGILPADNCVNPTMASSTVHESIRARSSSH